MDTAFPATAAPLKDIPHLHMAPLSMVTPHLPINISNPFTDATANIIYGNIYIFFFFEF